MNILSKLSAFGAAAVASTTAYAQENLPIIGQPLDKSMGFQPAATDLANDLQWLDGMLLVIITIITLFVVALLAFVIVRYNRKANPNPASFTHNSPLEVAWTVAPILILVFIGTFSLPTLFKQQEIPEGDIYIKVVGYQWYWGYEYTDHGFAFDSYMLQKDELAEHGYQEAQYRRGHDGCKESIDRNRW